MENQLSRILSTNVPPNALETATLQKGVDDLTGRISHLHSQLQELNRLEGQLRQYRSALSPIRRIPPEILAEVFRYVLPTVEDKVAETKVVDLGLVCKGWREATLLVHHFWNHLTVRGVAQRYDQMEAWLSRSGTIPRTVHFEWVRSVPQHMCSSASCPLSSPGMVKLLESGPRIQHLILECQRLQCLRRLLDSIARVEGRTWDEIQALDLIFLDDTELWPLITQTTTEASVYMHLPPITSLVLHLPHAQAAFSRANQSRIGRLDIPESVLERLTSLKLQSDWEGTHILSMLQHCPNLETLIYDSRFKSWSPRGGAVGLPRIPLPKLRTLKIQHDGIFNLLNFIDTPELETLELLGDGSVNGGSLGFQLETAPWLGNSGGIMQKVRVLHLSNREFEEAFELVHVVSNLPLLTHLKLDKIVVNWVDAWSGMAFEEEQTGRHCLRHVEVLEVLHVKQEYAEEFFPAVFGFLVERGPHPCALTVSFEEVTPPTQSDAEHAWDAWRNERGPGDTSLEVFGIDLHVVPAVDARSDEEEE